MFTRQKWTLREFPRITDNGILPCIMERLEGTPVRLYEKISKIPVSVVNKAFPGIWSIKKEIGHLIDLEPLWRTRIGEIASSIATMTAADMSNEKTQKTDHDSQQIHILLFDFTAARQKTIAMIDHLAPADFERSSFHARLKMPMKIIDLAYFIAEHDDHHLAQITHLSSMSSQKDRFVPV